MVKKLLSAAVMLAGLAFVQSAAAAPPPVGGLTQIGCVAIAGGPAGCTPARAIDGAESAVVSPDGQNVYVGSYTNTSEEGLAVFSRNPGTGALMQLPGAAGCLSADGASAAGPDTCTKVRGFGIGDGHDLVFTSDGRWAYLVNQHANPTDPPGSIVIFERDTSTGALTQLPGLAGCLTATGSSQDGPATCQTAPLVLQPVGISISPDNRFLYVSDGGTSQHIVVLARDAATGGLAEVQCLGQTAALSGCSSTDRALGGDQSLTISPDGLHAYSSLFYTVGGISIFDRDPVTGLLQQKAGAAGCISDTGNDNNSAATCAMGRVVGNPYGLAISHDGRALYVPSGSDNGLSIFHVSADGSLMQLPGAGGCITLDGRDNLGNPTCAVGRGLVEGFGAAISPDGRTIYEAADNNVATDGIAAFSLDASTGAVSQLPGPAGCITVDGSSGSTAGPCSVGGNALEGAYTPGISPGGNSVYVPGFGGQALVEYRRESGPSCTATSVTATYGAASSVALACRDADADPLSRSIVSPPGHGTLGTIDQAGGAVTYTPAQGFSGTDTFSFTASDGTNTSPPTTVTIAVSPPPVVQTPSRHAGSGAIRPTLTHVSQRHGRWREPGAAARAPVGTAFAFTLNEAAHVSLTFVQRAAGRNVHGRCVTQTASNRRRRSCDLPRGTLVVAGHAGPNRLAFRGRLGGRLLGPGRYTVTIVATSGARSSHRVALAFTIA